MTVATINYPASLDTADTLIRVVNKASSTIGAGGVNTTVTTIPVASAASAPSSGIAWCGNEAILYESKDATNLLTCTRHFDGTATEAHTAGDTIYFSPIIAAHHRVHSDAIIAIETLLGAAGVNVKPGGSNTQVQFNDSGVPGGDAGLVYDKAADALTVGGLNTAQSFRATGNVSAGTGSGAELLYASGAYLFAYTRPSGPYLPLNLDGIPININAQGSGNVVINTTAGNFDTIVKGDTDVNLLYIKASTDRVGIGIAAPSSKLHVYGGDVTITNGNLSILRDTVAAPNEITMHNRNPTGAYYNLIHFSRWGTVGSGGTPDNESLSQFRWEGLGSTGSYAQFGTFDMAIGTNTATGAGAVYQFNLYTAAGVYQTMFAMDSRFGPPYVASNVSGQDIDLIVQGDTDTRLIFADASTDRVGIGTGSPSYKFDVNGTMSAALLQYASVTGHKINLYGTNEYVIGVEGAELRISAGSATTDRVTFVHNYSTTPFFAASETAITATANVTITKADAFMTLVSNNAGNSQFNAYDTTDGGVVLFNQNGGGYIGRVNNAGTWVENIIGFDNTGATSLFELAGTGTRLVTASSTGLLSSVAFDADLATLSVPASTTISAYGATLVDDADAATARTTLGVQSGGAGDIWVERAGDTMTGNLIVSKSAPAITLQTAATGEQAYVGLSDQTTLYWLLRKTSTTHDFSLYNQSLGFEALSVASGTSIIQLNSQARDQDTIIKGDLDLNLFFVDASTDSIGIGNNAPTSFFDFKIGTAARASLRIPTNSTLLTTPVAGVIECATVSDTLMWTPNTTMGRNQIVTRPIWNTNLGGSALGPTVADYFGANSAMSFPANQFVYLEAWLHFTKQTAGTVTITVLNTVTFSTFSGVLEIEPAAGGASVFGAVSRAHIVDQSGATQAFPASPSLSVANHCMTLRCAFKMNSAGNIRIQVTSSAGTVTPRPMSHFWYTQHAGNTIGSYVA